MRDNGLDSIYVTSRDRKLKGIVVVDAVEQAAKEGKESIREIMTQDFRAVGPDEPLHNLFAMFSEKSFPIAVVDDSRKLLGVVVKGAVLDELAQAAEPTQAGEGESDNANQNIAAAGDQ
jgi:glycine betaine/proline transport system ATP-binding protein